MKKYITVSGDTWDLISFKNYGDYNHIGILLQENKNYMETFMFKGGCEINIPEDIPSPSTNLPPWKRGLNES